MKKIGLLLPQSKAFPKMGKEFINGLRLAGIDKDKYEFIIEGIGLGNDSNGIIDSIQKLVNQEEVHLTTGMLGHRGLSEIHDFVEGLEEPLLYSDLGATTPLDLKGRTNIWCNSLGLAHATYDLTRYLTNIGIKNIGISTSYYDCGYGFLEAIAKGLLHNNDDSRICDHFITPLNPREDEAAIMAEFVEYCKPDALIAFCSGIFAKEHASYLKENKVNEKVPLYTTLPTVNDAILTEFPEVFDGTKAVSSWFSGLETDENIKFIKEYKERYDVAPSIFSVLGYENGLLIEDYFKNNKKFEGRLKGPRGNIHIDDRLKRTSYSNYLYQLNSSDQGYDFDILETLKSDERFLEACSLDESPSGGWYNAYLCE